MPLLNLSFVERVIRTFDNGYLVWETISWFGKSGLSRQVVSYRWSTNTLKHGDWKKVFQNRWSLLAVVSQTRYHCMTRHGLHVCFSLFPKEEVYVVYTLQCYMGGGILFNWKAVPLCDDRLRLFVSHNTEQWSRRSRTSRRSTLAVITMAIDIWTIAAYRDNIR